MWKGRIEHSAWEEGNYIHEWKGTERNGRESKERGIGLKESNGQRREGRRME